jgi:hypothetical protein
MAIASAHLVFFSRPDDPGELRAVLQEALRLTKVDAAIIARHAPGISPQEVPADAAEHAVRAAAGLGVKGVAVPASEVPDVATAERVRHLRCTPGGLEVVSLEGFTSRTEPWDELKLISVGRVPLETPRHYVTDTLSHAGTPVPPDEYLAGRPIEGYEAWLIFEPRCRILRCDSEHMNYEYLDARKTGSGTTNFDLLVADIAAAAQAAFVPAATRKYLTHGPVLDYDFASSEALWEHTLVQYFLSRELPAA